MSEQTPERVHGQLIEGVHIAGYTFERACKHLEWMLEDNRWSAVAGKGATINDYLATVCFDTLRSSVEQRKRIANRIKELQPQASTRAIARTLGVSHQTVSNDISVKSLTPEPEKAQQTHESAVNNLTARAPALSRPDIPSAVKLADKTVRGTLGTSEWEWYTPTQFLTLARAVLGDIDLDPASSEAAQRIVNAAKFYTIETNGLDDNKEWHGRIWLNPPYAQPLIAGFISKLVAERKAGRVTAAIMLTHNYTDTSWFHEAASIADAICFTRGRVNFYHANGAIAAPTQGQAFFYFGVDVQRFEDVFRHIGWCTRPSRQFHERPAPTK